MRAYYKKLDKSCFYRGVTIPKECIDIFLFNEPLEVGTAREVIISWGEKNYKARFTHNYRKNSSSEYQLR